MKNKLRNVILGAGPAGMAAAMELQKKSIKFTLVEKDKQVGGLAKTYKFGEFLTDNGPHRFFSKNKYLYDFIGDMLGRDWIKVRRSTRQFIDGKFYDYPINAFQAFKNIGPFKAAVMLFDYILATFEYRVKKKKISNFEDYIIANFGRSLGNLNMLNYTEKQYGIKCTNLSADWAIQRIKGLNFREALMNALKTSIKINGSGSPKSLIDEFYYPAYGAGEVYEKIYKKIKKDNQIFLNTIPLKIKHQNRKITEIVLSNGKKTGVNKLVSSIPLGELISLLDPAAPREVTNTLRKLKYRSQVYIFLTINKKFVSHDQWIYFPETDIPLFRFSEMKNFSNKMSPKGKTSLFVEYFCWENDDMWNMDKKQLYELTIEWLEKLNFVKRNEVINYYMLKKAKTYPLYDLNYRKNLKTVLEYIDGFKNLITIGRPGRFKYTNQDHSLEMGILAARSIIENRKINVEDIGSESEYFEKGYIK